MRATLFVFFVNGASSVLMGNLMPFLRQTYDISYAQAGLLLSLPSWGNIASIFITSYLPSYIGRRKTVLLTAVWMAVAYLLITFGIGGTGMLSLAYIMMGVARGGNTNFSNIMMSTMPGKKSAIGYNLLHGAFAVGAVLSPLALIACTKNNSADWTIMTLGISLLCLIPLVVYLTMNLPAENITKSIKNADRSFLKNKNFWLGAAILFFYISTEYAITNWLVTYFKDTGILSTEVSQLMTSLIFIGRMIGAALVGRVSRKIILVVDGVGLILCFLLVFFSRTELPIFLGIMGVGVVVAVTVLLLITILVSVFTKGTEEA